MMMINYKAITGFLVILCLYCSFSCACTFAQGSGPADPGARLHVGDKFDGFKNVNFMRGDAKTLNWKDMKDKIVILDFFDTFCTVCISSMPHIQALQNQFSKQIQIINVTWQDQNTLLKFFRGNEFLKEKKVNLPVIYNDRQLRGYFPYQSAPHVVILYKGKVQAITFHRLITAENIHLLLKNGTIDLPLKDDFGQGNLVKNRGKSMLGVWLTGYQNGVNAQGLKFERDSITSNYRASLYNRSIYRALLMAWRKIEKPTALLRKEQVIWKVRDSSVYENYTQEAEAWDVKYAVSYERVDKVEYADSIYGRLILNDLQTFLGLKSYWSLKRQKCLILKECPVIKSNRSFGNMVQYANTDVFCKFMSLNEDFPLVSDQKQADIPMDIGTYDTLEELNEQLRRYGCFLEEGYADFPAFVIEEVAQI
ncbi:TlpA family protein disulfide reductase [Sphingobacterium athyrii]|uniref:Thioredoxin domain-containing protein n=1 Tax=Sphingobacterium athyrii TaxID=2152717 RepID=A0A363NUS9_9SPHI|nr:TlpA disulfide reductase family protein [Sphingobacterium athyrii]PUV24575.1 hypothetical protein DCO56_14635 [Sphingobacterium athyrii]